MELTALTSTKDLLGASYGKTKLAGDTSSSTFSDLLPTDRQPADRRDSAKSGAADKTPPRPERDRTAKYPANKSDSYDVTEPSTQGTPDRESARESNNRENAEGRAGATEAPKPAQIDRPQAEPERTDAAPRGDGQSSEPARAATEAAKPAADSAQSQGTTSTAMPADGSVESNGTARPSAATALIASLTGAPTEPAAPAPNNQTSPATPTPVSGSPDGTIANPNVQTESSGRAAAAYAAVQPQPAASSPAPSAATAGLPTQPGAPATPQPAIVPAQAATAAPDTSPPSPATQASNPAPAAATTGQPAAATPVAPTTPTAPAQPATSPATPVVGETPVTPKSEPSATQIIDSLVRAGGETARRPRAGLVPGRPATSGPATPGPRTTTGRSGPPQPAASPAAAQPLATAQSAATSPNLQSVTIAAATVAPAQTTERQTAPMTDNGRFTVDAGRPTIALPDQASGAVIKTAESQAATATRSARSPVQVPVSEQVAVRIQKAIATGTDRIEIHLKPASLGRVNVALEFAHDGRVLAVVSADSPDTLDMLKQDARSLERALQDAGLKTDSGSLSFNLRGNGENSAKADEFAGGSDRGEASDETADDAMPTDTPARMMAGSGLLDIHV